MPSFAQLDDHVLKDISVKSAGQRLRLINAIARLKLAQVVTYTLSYATSGKLRTVNSTHLISGQMHP
jgi:hypothetical protein